MFLSCLLIALGAFIFGVVLTQAIEFDMKHGYSLLATSKRMVQGIEYST